MNLKDFSAVTNQLARMVMESQVEPQNIFPFAIAKMNEMYELPINSEPTLDSGDIGESPIKRMQKFLVTLQKEMDEGKEIIEMMEHGEQVGAYLAAKGDGSNDLENTFAKKQVSFKWIAEGDDPILDVEEIRQRILVAIADWLGDMTVFNRSEAMKFGIPLESVLFLIMASNFTKLGANGLPIKDENGKFQKGPNFRPPEPAIHALLFNRESLTEEHIDLAQQVEMQKAIALPALLTDAVPEEFYEAEEEEEDEDEEDNE